MLGAQFVAAIQILVYAGGIVVLYLFVVMLVNVKRRAGDVQRARATVDARRRDLPARSWSKWASSRSGRGTPPDLPAMAGAAMPVSGNTEQVGWLLYTSYLIPFEVASMLLLIAMIGAIVLARKES